MILNNLSSRKQFFIRFLCVSFIFLLLWKPFSLALTVFYGHLFSLILKIFQSDISAQVVSKNIVFDYSTIFSRDIRFPVGDIDQVFLNVIIMVSLFISTPGLKPKKTLLYILILFGIMSCLYLFIFHMYSHTFLRIYMSQYYTQLDEQILQTFRDKFPESTMRLYDKILFHWNSWGWDVTPLILWLPVGYKKVIRKQNSRNS